MAGRILVVDDVATNRIVMKVKLTAACYTVEQAENGTDALRLARETKPDLILLDLMMPDMSGLEVCRALKAEPETADIPIVLITALCDRAAKMEGLEAGADDFLCKPVEEVTLLARVRSLLRASDSVRELRGRDEGVSAYGFAEAALGFEPKVQPGRVALVAPGPRGAVLWKAAIEERVGGTVQIMPKELALASAAEAEAPDVFVISVDLGQRNEGLRLLSDLRSRPGTRHSASVMILPEGDTERAAIALDLGASDVLHDPFDAQELAIRISAQLGRKRQSDRMRAGVRAGLEAAITDPLTGLYNRRFALHRMEQMLAPPAADLSVMMIDLDFFKNINDTYGHHAGDAVLREVAFRLRGQLKPSDLLARIGGEEFLVVLSGADREAASACAEQLRGCIGAASFDLGDGSFPIRVTASVGLTLPGGLGDGVPVTAEALIRQADRALYGAKAHGRDQVSYTQGAAA
ncbi:diguanylate cyclase [Gymnodinialimonas ceratoperidinii]|uniref:diguanylate cyclase n=1 Tax=Gymnodinialimonas ceratoperidinii TaxID=2856823 RepID=A0A8F6YBH0_9RHOB|nr:diguanylate cyclase [Gymnodinialimonas ceratoperidinii]QXT40959.1 diguanylate cyclase [Gymnodinialimonas ceratoperidinii]